jgi:hypothetical protein
MLDVPTNTSPTNANYCVLNPLSKQGVTLSDGNLGFSGTSVLAAGTTFAFPSSGKFYAEFQITTTPENGLNELVGVGPIATTGAVIRAYASNGQYFNGSAWVAFGSAWAINDIIVFACDIDNSQISVYKNNTLQGTVQSYTFSETCWQLRARASGTTTMNANFGQRPFTYTPPTGFNRLCTYNLPDSIVPVGAQYMAATTYTGNGSTQSIVNTVNGVSMQPDFVWIKGRSQVVNHRLLDSVRGVTKELYSDLTNAEATDANGLTAFGSNGFSLGTSTSYNNNTSTYVGWQWRASNASAVTNTAGTITSSVSANQTAGFSIVTWTQAAPASTVGHGLGVAPKMIFVKQRNVVNSWYVNSSLLTGGNDFGLSLNSTAAATNIANLWNNTAATSSVFSIGTAWGAGTMVAYCFAAVPGYSAFGSYTGNGSADGPFVYLGFRPRWILLKLTSSAGGGWYIYDTSRNTYNVMNLYLRPDASDAETTFTTLDSVSNGFKIRTTNTQFNGSGSTYIYAAFAENPFKNALAR